MTNLFVCFLKRVTVNGRLIQTDCAEESDRQNEAQIKLVSSFTGGLILHLILFVVEFLKTTALLCNTRIKNERKLSKGIYFIHGIPYGLIVGNFPVAIRQPTLFPTTLF